MNNSFIRMTREELSAYRLEVRSSVPCPICLAPVGSPCLSRKGNKERKSNHSDRNRAYRGLPPKDRSQAQYPIDNP